MDFKPFTIGVLGTRLSDEEAAFIARERPFGFILFARNIETPDQVAQLCADMREAAGWNAPVLIDQEGGRVQRIKPPLCPAYPPGARLGETYARNATEGTRAAWLMGRLHAFDLLPLGIDVNCAPLLDVLAPGAHDAIGDRALGNDAASVAFLARAFADGLLSGGVLPVIKHMPGQGRARSDSHYDLPRIDADLETLRSVDFAPFAELVDMPIAMTAHVVFEAIDEAAPATTSSKVVQGTIRGELGFDGLLLSDDVSMEALQGNYADRSRAILDAGCDIVLHCHGIMEQMVEMAAVCDVACGQTVARAERALAMRGHVDGAEEDALRQEFADLMGSVA